MAQSLMRNREVSGLIPGLAQWVAVSCGVGHRCGSDVASMWLRCRLAAAALTQPLAWEHTYATGAALKRQRERRGEERRGEERRGEERRRKEKTEKG